MRRSWAETPFTYLGAMLAGVLVSAVGVFLTTQPSEMPALLSRATPYEAGVDDIISMMTAGVGFFGLMFLERRFRSEVHWVPWLFGVWSVVLAMASLIRGERVYGIAMVVATLATAIAVGGRRLDGPPRS